MILTEPSTFSGSITIPANVTVTGSVTVPAATVNAATITGGTVTALPSGTTTVTGTVSIGAATVSGAVTVSGGVAITPHANAFTASGVTTGTGAVTLQGAGGAGVKNYVTGMQVWNSGTVQSVLTFDDGSSFTMVAQAGVTRPIQFDPPLATAANAALTFTPATGVSSIGVNVQGYTGT